MHFWFSRDILKIWLARNKCRMLNAVFSFLSLIKIHWLFRLIQTWLIQFDLNPHSLSRDIQTRTAVCTEWMYTHICKHTHTHTSEVCTQTLLPTDMTQLVWMSFLYSDPHLHTLSPSRYQNYRRAMTSFQHSVTRTVTQCDPGILQSCRSHALLHSQSQRDGGF